MIRKSERKKERKKEREEKKDTKKRKMKEIGKCICQKIKKTETIKEIKKKIREN